MAKNKYIIPEEERQVVAEPVAEYANALPVPTPAQITVNIEDVSMLKEIKHAM